MRGWCVALVVGAAACDRAPVTQEIRRPRDALGQLVLCALDQTGEQPDPGRFEGALRQALRGDRGRFATRAGACESALETEGGRHPCLARMKARWSALLTVVQRPGVDAIDQDMAVRRAGEAYIDATARCPR